jgi:ferrochelatase
VASWYSEASLVALLAARVRDAVGTVTGRAKVIFTAHSLPERVVEAGDTYPEQLAESARLVAQAAGLDEWLVAWQSAGRTPDPWLGPDVRDVVRALAADDLADAVVVCPIGFVADHLEVLFDLDIEVADVAAALGLAYVRTASLNDDPAFIATLADVIMAADGAA